MTVAVGLRRGDDGARNDRRIECYERSTATRALLEHRIELSAAAAAVRVSRATVAGGVCARDSRRYNTASSRGTAAAELYAYTLGRARTYIMLCIRTTRARSRLFKRFWSRP